MNMADRRRWKKFFKIRGMKTADILTLLTEIPDHNFQCENHWIYPHVNPETPKYRAWVLPFLTNGKYTSNFKNGLTLCNSQNR